MFSASLILAVLAIGAESRTWHDTAGKKTEAAFAGIDFERAEAGDTFKVRLLLPDGRTASVAWERLSASDQAFVRGELEKKLAGGSGEPKTTPAASAPPARLTSRETYKAALGKSVSLEAIEMPLKDVVSYLQSATKVAFDLDLKGLEEVGVGIDTLITVNLKNVSVRVVLEKVLKDHALAYRYANNAIQITSESQVASALYTQIYRVNDLFSLAPGPGGQPILDAEPLMDLITSQVEPEAWNEVGGPASLDLDGKLQLVVKASESTHEKLEAFLKQLRAKPR
jgi:hypothetical protein